MLWPLFYILVVSCPRSAPTIPKPHFPSKSTISLPPLSKGGGLTASHKLLHYCVCLRYTCPFYIANFSAVKTEGLLHRSHHQWGFPHHPSKSTMSLPPLEKGEVAWRHCKTVILYHLHFVIYRTVSKIAILLPSRRWGLLLIRTINEIFRTIPRSALPHLTYERSVCFASALSPSLFVMQSSVCVFGFCIWTIPLPYKLTIHKNPPFK